MPDPVDVLAAVDPVDAVLSAYSHRRPLALRTSGTTARPRWVVRTAASWVDSFPAVSELLDLGPQSRVWVPGPLSATMNLFAAAHARSVGAEVVPVPDGATHGCLTPTALTGALDDRIDVRDMHLVVAGDRLGLALLRRAAAAGARVSHYYGAAELSFVAWGSGDDGLRAFPGVEVQVRNGAIWARSPYLSLGYLGTDGPLTRDGDGFATVGDRGRFTAGVLTVTGRGVEAVVTGGATVLVDDVEQAVRTACGADVVVVGAAHSRLGQVVTAVSTDLAALTAARSVVREMPATHRPRLWFLLPRWPLTPAGKVDRAAIAELVDSGGLPPVRGVPSPGPAVGA